MCQNQISVMTKIVTTDTPTCKEKGKYQFIYLVNHNQNPCIGEFGLSLSTETQKFVVSVLPSSTLKYNKQIGDVDREARTTTFLKLL